MDLIQHFLPMLHEGFVQVLCQLLVLVDDQPEEWTGPGSLVGELLSRVKAQHREGPDFDRLFIVKFYYVVSDALRMSYKGVFVLLELESVCLGVEEHHRGHFPAVFETACAFHEMVEDLLICKRLVC